MCARPRRVPSSRETGASSPQPPRNLEGMRSPAPSVQGDGHPPLHRKETPLRCPSPFRASPLQLRRAAHLAASFPPSHGAASRVIEVGFSVSGKATRSRGRLVRELTTAFKLQKQPRRCAALAAALAARRPRSSDRWSPGSNNHADRCRRFKKKGPAGRVHGIVFRGGERAGRGRVPWSA